MRNKELITTLMICLTVSFCAVQMRGCVADDLAKEQTLKQVKP